MASPMTGVISIMRPLPPGERWCWKWAGRPIKAGASGKKILTGVAVPVFPGVIQVGTKVTDQFYHQNLDATTYDRYEIEMPVRRSCLPVPWALYPGFLR